MKMFATFPAGRVIAAWIPLITPATAIAAVNMEYVTIGDAGNVPDDSTGSIFGAVNYLYRIGQYEVTNAQYQTFLNAVDPTGANANNLYNPSMGSQVEGGISYSSGAADGSKYSLRANMSEKPVNYVSWYDAARFTNWLHNGQGSSSTETGVYTLSDSPGLITRNVHATVWLPSVNEWYKAAYYDPTPGASSNNYWEYPTQSDTLPTVATADATGDVSNPGVNVVNFLFGANWNNSEIGNVTTVGSAGSSGFYGTYDQGGNVWEWTEEMDGPSWRAVRGSSWVDEETGLSASTSHFASAHISGEGGEIGFRVASIPETRSLMLSILAGGAMLLRRDRRFTGLRTDR